MGGAPWCGRWQLPAKPAYLRMAACRPSPTHLASTHNTAALPCKAHSGYAD